MSSLKAVDEDCPDERRNLELRFHDEMLEIYRRAKNECRYNAARFLQMVSETGGLETARTLLASTTVSDGFSALWRCGRLDLTVEALALKPPWCTLFTTEQLAIARKRLLDLGYIER